MPEAQRLYTQWRNANENTKYPFSSRATLTNGNVTIPEEVFLDARLYPTGGVAGQYLSSIEKDANTITLTISDQVNGELASAEVTIADIVAENVNLLELHDSFSRIAGVLVTEPARLGLLTSLPIGVHTFTIDQTEFTATVVTPLPNTGLRSVIGGGVAHYGDVWLVGGLGVVLEHEYDVVRGEDQVVINVVGEPLSKRIVCEDEGGIGVLDTGFITTGVTPRFDHTLIAGADTLTIYVEGSHAPVSAWNLRIQCASGSSGVKISPDDFGDLKACVCAMDVDDTVLRVQPDVDGITFGVIGGRVSG